VLALTGSVMRMPPKIEGVSDQVETHFEDITLTGQDLQAFAKMAVQEVLTTGRAGVLLDMPTTESPGTTARPYWVLYRAEQIINWRVLPINGVPVITMVVLKEETEKDPGQDPFLGDCEITYRVLKLVDGVYSIELWKPQEGDTGQTSDLRYVLDETITPRMFGKPLDYLPFVFINPMTIEAEPEKPPLLDLVDVNLSHYINSADLEHGRHFTALPTPWVTGVGTESGFTIGSSRAWVLPNVESSVGMLEFDGQGLGALEKALDAKERLMVVLGARMLEEQKWAAEAADTLRIRGQGENSMLATIAGTVSVALTCIAYWHAEWVGTKETEDISIKLNQDYQTNNLTPQELDALVKSWQANAISYSTLYFNLEQGEITRPGVDAETEQDLIEAENPQPMLSIDPLDPTMPKPGMMPAKPGKKEPE